uniref:Uncharacterized protein n=1 Tax=Rangifer tarandus platyrhynchus TaxID=3082113 RepID=A0ACB0EM99_RANTA|nr:unnamed protein product [Rangifer tarandus platyrhynchus]
MQTSLHIRCAAALCLQSGRGGEPSILVLEMRPVSCAEGRSPEGPTPAPPVLRRGDVLPARQAPTQGGGGGGEQRSHRPVGLGGVTPWRQSSPASSSVSSGRPLLALHGAGQAGLEAEQKAEAAAPTAASLDKQAVCTGEQGWIRSRDRLQEKPGTLAALQTVEMADTTEQGVPPEPPPVRSVNRDP